VIENIFTIFLENLNYFSIALLMVIESSFIPFPSAVVMIPAGFLAYQGKLNIFFVIFSGIVGSILGALVNYYIGLKLGRKLILKYQRFLFINTKHLEWTEEYFKKNGAKTIFFCRLIPAVRQYISIPAGFARMEMKKFIFFTTLGVGIWVAILTCLGYFLGVVIAKNVVSIFNYIVIGLLMVMFFMIVLFYFISRKSKKH